MDNCASSWSEGSTGRKARLGAATIYARRTATDGSTSDRCRSARSSCLRAEVVAAAAAIVRDPLEFLGGRRRAASHQLGEPRSATCATASVGDIQGRDGAPPRARAVRTRRPGHRQRRRAPGPLLVQQFLDPAQRAAQGLRIGACPAQGQGGLEFGSDGIRYHLQRFRCVSLHSAALHCARCAID
jgi:hypothetical protein